jgi:peptidoglycan/LPS O-acetylase OafA/YrhL
MPLPETSPAPGRIKFIDALRGLAACQVVAFHTFIVHAEQGFGDKYKNIAVFREGWLGVQLFFMISGFVILMTLPKCANLADFILRRYWRLLPAILITTSFSYVFANAFPSIAQFRPDGVPTLIQILMSATLLHPMSNMELFGVYAPQNEGAFWSLFAELKFYVYIGILYFLAGDRGALTGLIGLSALVAVAKYFGMQDLWGVLDKASILHFPWFAAGAMAFVFQRDRSPFALILALLSAAVGIYALSDNSPNFSSLITFASLNIALFIAPIFSGTIRRILERRLLLFFGFVSYPMYLVHENFMASVLGYSSGQPEVVRFAVAAVAFANVLVISWLIAAHGEAFLQRVFKPAWLRLRIAVGADCGGRETASEANSRKSLAEVIDSIGELTDAG